ncbi:MAG: extracellular solute-binding protein, partial [Patescibacteria group bacterium]
MKPFHAVLLGIFVVMAIGAVLVLSSFTGRDERTVGTVVVWGPVPDSIVGTQISELKYLRGDLTSVSYRSFEPSTFMATLVEAIAANRGPDLVVFPASYLVKHGDKLQPLPYSVMSQRTFRDTFIEAGEVFLGESSFTGFPYIVDPLVLYWNRTLFTEAGIANPPRYWDEVTTLAPKLAKADKNGTLTQSAIALGSWDNVGHAKAIILSLMRELGDPVVARGEGGRPVIAPVSLAQESTSPAYSAFRFYTEFANPTKPAYSWNRSQPSSRDAFLAGRLALYVGRASELYGIREANPNLNFDITSLPEARGAGKYTESELHALAVPRGSSNPQGALVIAGALTDARAQELVVKFSRLPSVRRDLLVVSPEDPYSEVFRTAALSAFAFFDPDPAGTEDIFRRAVENIS